MILMRRERELQKEDGQQKRRESERIREGQKEGGERGWMNMGEVTWSDQTEQLTHGPQLGHQNSHQVS